MTPLFGEQADDRSSPRGLIASFLFHVSALVLFAEAMAHNPLIIEASVPQYRAQIVDLRSPASKAPAPRLPVPPFSSAQEQNSAASATSEKSDAAKAVSPPAPAQDSSPQTLLRPTSVTHALLEEIPIPALLMVSSDNSANRVSPPSQPPAMPDAKPELAMPIDEHVADVLIPSSAMPVNSFPLTASTTSPIASRDATTGDRPPQTPSSNSNAMSTNALSISNVRLAEGSTSLPMTNEIAGKGNPDGESANKKGISSQGTASGGLGNDSVVTADNGRGTRRVTFAKDGRFGIVVVGASLEELYPQTASIWGSRLAYTVYLNVGTSRRWILQYSPQSPAAAMFNGKSTRMEPPWPTDVVVPNVEGEVNADALLIHGYLSPSGRFEKLAVAFPPGFPLSQFVLDALRQWQFRPAKQDGIAAAVEVLLIVP